MHSISLPLVLKKTSLFQFCSSSNSSVLEFEEIPAKWRSDDIRVLVLIQDMGDVIEVARPSGCGSTSVAWTPRAAGARVRPQFYPLPLLDVWLQRTTTMRHHAIIGTAEKRPAEPGGATAHQNSRRSSRATPRHQEPTKNAAERTIKRGAGKREHRTLARPPSAREQGMASALLRASALRGSAFRRAASGGEGLAARRGVSLPSSPLRRLVNSGAPSAQPPKSPDDKLNALVDEILARKGASVPHDLLKSILLTSNLVRHESDAKNISRTYLSSGVLAFGIFLGYADATDRAKRARDGARSAK